MSFQFAQKPGGNRAQSPNYLRNFYEGLGMDSQSVFRDMNPSNVYMNAPEWAMRQQQFDIEREGISAMRDAFKTPERRPMEYRRTEMQPTQQPQRPMWDQSTASFGREPVPGVQNYLARLMGNSSAGNGMGFGGTVPRGR